MNHFSLFTGIGGIDLAAEWAGFKTVGQCEIDPTSKLPWEEQYNVKVLFKHWPDVPKWGDIFELKGEEILDKCGRISLLSGGFPCQPFSAAGKRKGQADERYLWPEMFRIIREVKPQWVLGENVRGILSIDAGRTFGRILADLAESGYRVGWLCYGAGDVGAPHKRERVFIVAHAEQSRTGDNDQEACNEARGACETGRKGVRQGNRQACTGGAGTTGQDVADAESRQSWQQETRNRREGTCGRSKEMGHATEQGLQSREDVADTEKPKGAMDRPIASEQEQGQFGGRGGEGVLAGIKKYAREQATERTAQPGLGGVLNGFSAGMDRTKWPAGPGEQYPWEPPRIATGIKDRVARLKALGNAVVPQQVYPILKAIAEIERGVQK